MAQVREFSKWQYGSDFQLRILDTIDEMYLTEKLQAIVWPGSDLEVVPAHLLITAVHNGGLAIGAYYIGKNQDTELKELGTPPLIGFVFGFLGSQQINDKVKIKHLSHQMGVHPKFQGKGIGFALKRAQWQMVRKQGLDLITWTYDPLLSLNAHLNIHRLGSICRTYLEDVYGPLRDELNKGLPTDRFQVEMWVNSNRVKQRLSYEPRQKLDLAHFIAADATKVNPTYIDKQGLPRIAEQESQQNLKTIIMNPKSNQLILVEIPSNYYAIKASSNQVAKEWRYKTREIFETLFRKDYLVTDFIYLAGKYPRSYYVLSYGESTL